MDTPSLLSTEHATRPASSNSSPSSMLGRKRELKSIPGSFSYNLGHRNSASSSSPPPPRLDIARANGPCRRVKSIVAWIESAAASETGTALLSTSGDDAAANLKPSISSYKTHGSSPDESPPPPPPPRRGRLNSGGADVDSDCPTFLNYQRYYTQVSLARCLDEPQRKSVLQAAGGMEGRICGGDGVILDNGLVEYKADELASEKLTTVKNRSSAEVAAL